MHVMSLVNCRETIINNEKGVIELSCGLGVLMLVSFFMCLLFFGCLFACLLFNYALLDLVLLLVGSLGCLLQ